MAPDLNIINHKKEVKMSKLPPPHPLSWKYYCVPDVARQLRDPPGGRKVKPGQEISAWQIWLYKEGSLLLGNLNLEVIGCRQDFIHISTGQGELTTYNILADRCPGGGGYIVLLEYIIIASYLADLILGKAGVGINGRLVWILVSR